MAVALLLFLAAPVIRRWHHASLVLNEFGDFPMMGKMLLTLKQRAEHSP